MTHLVLASASPARLSILRAAGVEPEVVVSGVDESGVSGSAAYVAGELARLKARAVAAETAGDQMTASSEHSTARQDAPRTATQPHPPQTIARPSRDTVILGCDSVLELNGEVFGKPDDAADARDRWLRMRGKSGVLHTGHHLIRDDRETGAVASTVVRFGDITDAELDAYIATAEPLRVAGAFTLDGLGGWFVDGIDGDPGTVIGLSLPLLRQLLAEVDLSVTDLWRSSR